MTRFAPRGDDGADTSDTWIGAKSVDQQPRYVAIEFGNKPPFTHTNYVHL